MPYQPKSTGSPFALIAILAAHAGLVYLLAQGSVIVSRDAPPSALLFVELAPKPPPRDMAADKSAPETPRRRTVSAPTRPRAEPEVTAPNAPPADAPPSFDFSVDGAAWGKGGGGVTPPKSVAARAPDDYADRVKARINARVRRPAAAVYASGGGVVALRECTIPYEIVVGRAGQVIEFRIEPCGDAALDDAAREALRESGPHPTPPGDSASHLIYGSINFKASRP